MSGTLKTLVAGTVIAGGIVVSGIVWNGSEHLDNVKNKVDDLVSKVQILDDTKTGLENLLDELQQNAADKIATANGIIVEKTGQVSELNATIEQLESQIADLQSQLENSADLEEAQAEINRLQSELETANTEVEQLNADVEAAYATVADVEETEFNPENYDTSLPEVTGDPANYENFIHDTAHDVLSANHISRLQNDSIKNYLTSTFGITLVQVRGVDGKAYILINENEPTIKPDVWEHSNIKHYMQGQFGTEELYLVTKDTMEVRAKISSLEIQLNY